MTDLLFVAVDNSKSNLKTNKWLCEKQLQLWLYAELSLNLAGV